MEEIKITEEGKEALLTLIDELDKVRDYIINDRKLYNTLSNIRERIDAVLYHPHWDLSDFPNLMDIIEEK